MYALPIVSLSEAASLGADAIGSKASNLAHLLAGGLPVPDGFVIRPLQTEELERLAPALVAAAASLGTGPFAVRSSAAAEDLAEASFAGQYESILEVGPADLVRAVAAVLESNDGQRPRAYRQQRAGDTSVNEPGMAVLIQRMVRSDAAGVAFSANPLTGRRDEVVVTAVRGLGDRLVSGEAIGDEWIVRGDKAACTRSTEKALTEEQARAVASLARQAATLMGTPQDIEWAIEADRLCLLQSRPMTALPEPVAWDPPGPGLWARNVHLGEWLPEPVTPLFQTWLLPLLEAGFARGMRTTIGTEVPFEHAVLHGWYYATPAARLTPGRLVRALLEGRTRLLRFIVYGLIRVNSAPDVADRVVLRRLARTWRDELMPRYEAAVARGGANVERATEAELVGIVDQVGAIAGEDLWALAVVGGSAWKMEGALARFLRSRVPPDIAGSVQTLLSGLDRDQHGLSAHATSSADWVRPTAGELGWSVSAGRDEARRERLVSERLEIERRCQAALADRPRDLARFEALLGVAQRYARLREHQARSFTLGWPLLRQCAQRLGEGLVRRGVVTNAEDVYFLARPELEATTNLDEYVAERRATWEGQRRLTVPLSLGHHPAEALIRRTVDAVRTGERRSDGTIVGHPASPGRASGRVRIVRDQDDFERFHDGEILVAIATTPGWTPLFARAAAVVTDAGTLAAHASLVAREYGIPAVVATGDATSRLHDGEVVLVDGSAGTVEFAE